MSTYIYLLCRDHNPAIQADGESGQHLTDLPQLRQDIANRDAIVHAMQELDLYPYDSSRRLREVTHDSSLSSSIGCSLPYSSTIPRWQWGCAARNKAVLCRYLLPEG